MFNRFLHTCFVLVTTFIPCFNWAQQPAKPNSTDIYRSIQKLNFLGSVLYVAAHPDDENTKMIAHFANHVHARTAYLSLTRGDGGQNLIGAEIRELLGVIRTNELVEARKVDGGEQLFTRANDFGFSKVPSETLEIWDKEQVLADVVWAIRKFQPDVIINRFDHRTPGTTHGHHTASAMLSLEAFDLAADNTRFASQLKHVQTWQAKRIFFNTSWWFFGSQEKFDAADKSNFISLKTGLFDPTSGLSNSEISALSRSKHQSQGFGTTGARGEEIEYLELLKGNLPKDHQNLFEGINTTWSRVKGGEAIGKILYQVEKQFDFKNPAASIPALLKAYTLIQQLEDAHWRHVKTEEIKAIIAACSGLFLEVSASEHITTPGSKIMLNTEAIVRSGVAVSIEKLRVNGNQVIGKSEVLKNNVRLQFKDTFFIPENAHYTSAYWLNQPWSLGMYEVNEQEMIGLPLNPVSNSVEFELKINGVKITYTQPIIYKENSPEIGEIYRPFEIVPKATVKMEEDVFIFSSNASKQVKVLVKSAENQVKGTISLEVPAGWKVTPSVQNFSILMKEMEQEFLFTVEPPIGSSEGKIVPVVRIGSQRFDKKRIAINYSHIPFQTILLPAAAKLVKLEIQKKGESVAYIEGAGDVIPASLEQIGYKVTVIKPEQISASQLAKYDAVVVGIRAYNTIDALKFKQAEIFKYVKNGGTVIVQYNTNGKLVVDSLAPFALQLSRDRVTEENAEVRFLAPNHPVLNTPNKITAADFEGWEQERGLYFAGQWDAAFTPILACNDANESSKSGGLLVAQYGKGYYIYTGFSWFREFPAGVPGAYRIFANLISIGK